TSLKSLDRQIAVAVSHLLRDYASQTKAAHGRETLRRKIAFSPLQPTMSLARAELTYTVSGSSFNTPLDVRDVAYGIAQGARCFRSARFPADALRAPRSPKISLPCHLSRSETGAFRNHHLQRSKLRKPAECDGLRSARRTRFSGQPPDFQPAHSRAPADRPLCQKRRSQSPEDVGLSESQEIPRRRALHGFLSACRSRTPNGSHASGCLTIGHRDRPQPRPPGFHRAGAIAAQPDSSSSSAGLRECQSR